MNLEFIKFDQAIKQKKFSTPYLHPILYYSHK